ncbi:MAG TPA: acyl-CoA dehydrogenase, partial [Marinobacter adhaerens]|nr:acyl-CoA dehydrogenase [Marinobacter adhaerens]
MASAPWNDLLGFDAQLDETERQVQDSIRSFCDEQLMPGITEANRHEKFDRSIFNQMGEL